MNENTAFDYLVATARQAKLRNPSLPTKERIQNKWSAIGFSLFKKRMIAPLGEICEMLEVPKATRLPGVQPWVIGIANFRGRLLPLFDLEIFFAQKTKVEQKKRRVLVIELGDLYAGIIVNEVYGMLHFPDDTECRQLPDDLMKIAPYSKGCVEQESIDWALLSPHTLVKDPRFFNAAIN